MKIKNTSIDQSPEQENTLLENHEQSGNIFDSYIRQILGQIVFFVDFLLHYADPNVLKHLDLNRITPFPTHSFDRQGKERISDLVFLCGLKGSAGVMGVIIIFEHVGNSIFYLPKRLLQYLVGAWNFIAKDEKKKIPLPSPYFIVVRTGKKSKKKNDQPEQKQKTSNMCVQVPGLKTVTGLDFDYTNIVLSEYDLDKLSGNPVTKSVLGVMKVLTEGNPKMIAQALAPIADLDDYDEQRYIIQLSLLLYSNYLRARNQKVDDAEIDRILTPIFNNPEEKKNMITTIFEDKFLEGKAVGITEGKAVGITEGIAEGIAMGEVKWKAGGKAESIATVLEARFGKVPAKVVKSINSYSNPDVLESWTRQAATCKSLKEFEKMLK
jgi:hypothetical protein